MNELAEWSPGGGLPWCRICGKTVDELRLENVDQIVPIRNWSGMLAYEFTGYSTRTMIVRCHGQEWRLEQRCYDGKAIDVGV